MSKKSPTLPPRPVSDIPINVLDILTTELGVDAEEITRDASLVGDLHCDDLDLAELAIALEEEFKIAFTESDEERMDTATVNDVLDILEKHGVKL